MEKIQMFPDLPMSQEIEGILIEEQSERAKVFVENLNNHFFEEVAKGLTHGQKLTFEFADGSKRIMTNCSDMKMGSEEIDFFVDSGGRQRCANCRRSISKMKVFFNRGHVACAIKAFEYAVQNNVQFVQINDLGLTTVEYTMMNKLVKFGLAFRNPDILIRKSNVGVYGIPRKRISDFIRGQWKVASCYIQNPTIPEGQEGRREMSQTRITIDQVPSISALRDEIGDHLTRYEWNEQDAVE